MLLKNFESLNYDNALMVVNRGQHLAARQEGKVTVFLYKVQGFYVEVLYLSKYSHIYGFRAFGAGNAERLQVYRSQNSKPAAVLLSDPL